MAQVIWGTNGRRDLQQIAEYLASYSKPYATAWVKRIYAKVGRLASFPRMGRKVPEFDREEFRQLPEGDYRIIYELLDEDVVPIIKILHNSGNLERLNGEE